jgi:hypothetical protein
MLIKNTDATYCKIKDIKISGLEAYITLLVYSSSPQTTEDNLGQVSRVFSFFLEDEDTGDITKLNNNNYWVDRCNNYNNDTNNIDINMYKEIILTIDISNLNNSKMMGNRWVRHCKILIKSYVYNSATKTTEFINVWESSVLELISKEIIVPKISNIKLTTTSEDNLNISFTQKFESQEDFNYSNNSITTNIEIYSAYNNHLIETYTVLNTDIDNDVVHINTLTHKFNSPIIIKINILNNIGETLIQVSKFYNPNTRHNVFIKQNTQIKQVNTCTIKNKQVLNIKNK